MKLQHIHFFSSYQLNQLQYCIQQTIYSTDSATNWCPEYISEYWFCSDMLVKVTKDAMLSKYYRWKSTTFICIWSPLIHFVYATVTPYLEKGMYITMLNQSCNKICIRNVTAMQIAVIKFKMYFGTNNPLPSNAKFKWRQKYDESGPLQDWKRQIALSQLSQPLTSHSHHAGTMIQW